jgi:hypothetical protein
MGIINGTLSSANSRMHAAEFIVIYLTYGAPFGVYEVTCIRRKLSIAEIYLVAAKFLFWPMVVAFWISNWFLNSQKYAIPDLEREIDVVRKDLESAAFDDRSAAAILSFREVVTRYTGLTLMLRRSKPSLNAQPLIELGDMETPKTALACFYRRHHQKLAFHQQRARKEFIEIIGRISASQPDHNDLLSNSIKLAILLNDFDCAAYLSTRLPNDMEKRVCNPLSARKAES